MRKRFLSALVASLRSLVAFSSTSSAQSQMQGFTDELEACVTLPNGSMWLSTVELKSQLELATGQPATIAHATTFANAALSAGGGRYFRCDNCQPVAGSDFALTLQSKGYTASSDGTQGALPGSSGWVRFTAP